MYVHKESNRDLNSIMLTQTHDLIILPLDLQPLDSIILYYVDVYIDIYICNMWLQINSIHFNSISLPTINHIAQVRSRNMQCIHCSNILLILCLGCGERGAKNSGM